MPSKRNPLVLRLGDEFNPWKRCGEPKRVHGRRYLHTWFTTEIFRSYATDKMMGDLLRGKVIRRGTSNQAVLYERVRFVYYEHETGMFYRAMSRKNKERLGDCFALEPIDGPIWTVYPNFVQKNGLTDCTIYCVGGQPDSILVGEDSFYVDDDSWPAMESFLGLDESFKPAKYRPVWAINYAKEA